MVTNAGTRIPFVQEVALLYICFHPAAPDNSKQYISFTQTYFHVDKFTTTTKIQILGQNHQNQNTAKTGKYSAGITIITSSKVEQNTCQ